MYAKHSDIRLLNSTAPSPTQNYSPRATVPIPVWRDLNPQPHSAVRSSYLHPIPSESDRHQCTSQFSIDSLKESDHYQYIPPDSMENSLSQQTMVTPQEIPSSGRTDPLPPIPASETYSVTDDDNYSTIKRSPCFVPLLIIIMCIVVVGIVLSATLPIFLRDSAANNQGSSLCTDNGFYPASDTYPLNCGKYYVRCVNSSETQVRYCPNGQQYAFNQTAGGPCTDAAEVTYCEVQRTGEAPNVTVDVMTYLIAAYIGTDAVIQCAVRNVRTFRQVDFLYNQTTVASFDISTTSTKSLIAGISVDGQKVADGYDVVLTLSNATCQQRGKYTCVARDSRRDAEKSVIVTIMRTPTPPTLEIPRLVEGLQHDPLTCYVPSMGQISSFSFSWFLKSSTATTEISKEAHFDTACYEDATCNSHGESRLTVQTEMEWDKRQLCCRVEGLLHVNSSSMETCQNVTVLPLLEITQDLVATIGTSVNITCTIRDLNVTEVTFHDASSVITSNRTDMTLYVGGNNVTERQVILSIRNVTCSHGGAYTCRILRSTGAQQNVSTTLHLRRLPETPRLTIPPIAETYTAQNPVCTADTLGYYPAMTFKWIRMRQDGTKETFDASRYTYSISEDKLTCNTSGSSTFDGQQYRDGLWNNSQLCCQLVEPGTGKAVSEVCGQAKTLPANFCSMGTVPLRCYPYEPCNTYVNCNVLTKVVYFNYCNDGFCFDPPTQTCSRISSATC